MRKPASREIISASVELCETEVCFLHIPPIGTNVWLPNVDKSPPDVDFESSRSPQKNQSPDKILIIIVVLYFRNIVWIHMRDECKNIKRAKRFSQTLFQFVMARASLFADHRMSGLRGNVCAKFLKEG